MPDSLEAEFAAMMARAGLTIPADRHAAIMTAYKELRGQIDLLRQPRTPAEEPSNVFRLTPQ